MTPSLFLVVSSNGSKKTDAGAAVALSLGGIVLVLLVVGIALTLIRRSGHRKALRPPLEDRLLAAIPRRGAASKPTDAWAEAGRRLRIDKHGNPVGPEGALPRKSPDDHDTVDLDPGDLSRDDIEAGDSLDDSGDDPSDPSNPDDAGPPDRKPKGPTWR